MNDKQSAGVLFVKGILPIIAGLVTLACTGRGPLSFGVAGCYMVWMFVENLDKEALKNMWHGPSGKE